MNATDSDRVRVAAAQYAPTFLASWAAYEAKVERWVREAVADGAGALAFPEYFSMELASLFAPEIYASLDRQLYEMQALAEPFVRLFAELAKRYAVTIVAGSFPFRVPTGEYRNRSFLFRPEGTHVHQDKIQMTRFESETWLISGADRVDTFETAFGAVGIAICYDGEFPLIARKQAEAGARVIFVPSCTDTLAGYHRVRIGAQARALENQCYVVHASLVGDAPWSPAIDVNVGAAAIYTPVDYGFPPDGVLAIGELGVSGWVFADLELDRMAEIRATGQVFNFRDWPGQANIT